MIRNSSTPPGLLHLASPSNWPVYATIAEISSPRSKMGSMNAKRASVALWCALSYALLNLCSAQVPTCAVTQDADQTTYSISGLPHVSSVKASDCEYSWTPEHVLANHRGQANELVKRNSINELVTSKCFPEMVYRRGCISEREGFTINCTVTCSGNASLLMDKEISRPWIAAFPAVVVFILVLVVFLSFMRYKFRDKRICSCDQPGCMYTPVKTQNMDPDVEAGKG